MMSVPGVSSAVRWVTQVSLSCGTTNPLTLYHTPLHAPLRFAACLHLLPRCLPTLPTPSLPPNPPTPNPPPPHHNRSQYVVKELLLYPNSVSVPIMTNFGAPRDPVGMLHVRLHRCVRACVCSGWGCVFGGVGWRFGRGLMQGVWGCKKRAAAVAACPTRSSIPMTQPAVSPAGAPMTVHRIEGFKTSDIMGKGDPYVVFQVGVGVGVGSVGGGGGGGGGRMDGRYV